MYTLTTLYSCCWAAQEIAIDMVGPDIQMELLPGDNCCRMDPEILLLGSARENEAWMDPVLPSGSKGVVLYIA